MPVCGQIPVKPKIKSADKQLMTKHIDFEDSVFILNVRIRMILDLLRLDIDTGIFLHKTLDDLKFIGTVLDALTEKLLANPRFLDRDIEADNLIDTEWQFKKLLHDFSCEASPFSVSLFPETESLIVRLRQESEERSKAINDVLVSAESGQPEPVVSQMEMNELLKGILPR